MLPTGIITGYIKDGETVWEWEGGDIIQVSRELLDNYLPEHIEYEPKTKYLRIGPFELEIIEDVSGAGEIAARKVLS